MITVWFQYINHKILMKHTKISKDYSNLYGIVAYRIARFCFIFMCKWRDMLRVTCLNMRSNVYHMFKVVAYTTSLVISVVLCPQDKCSIYISFSLVVGVTCVWWRRSGMTCNKKGEKDKEREILCGRRA